VEFVGTMPAPQTIPMSSDPTCAAAHPDGLVVAEVRGTGGGLADTFVFISGGLEDRAFAVPETPVVIDQRGCSFVPRIAGVRAGQPIVFRSSDDTLHNVHGEPKRSPRWNFGLPRQDSERRMVLDAPEVLVPVRCDVHPWMRLDLGVVAHPYFTVTAEDGTFRFDGLPVGTYTIAAVHPKLGRREAPIIVAANGTSNATLAYKGRGSP
jgi:plastocyanin